MSFHDTGIERDPSQAQADDGPDYDFEVHAAFNDSGRVTLRTLADGEWFPKSPVDLYEALMDIPFEIIGGGSPNDAMLAVAMELLYRDSWWLDLQ